MATRSTPILLKGSAEDRKKIGLFNTLLTQTLLTPSYMGGELPEGRLPDSPFAFLVILIDPFRRRRVGLTARLGGLALSLPCAE